jgi:hypothetical protein
MTTTTTTDKLELRSAIKNRSAVIYGPSGSYKTSNLGFIALWLYQLTANIYGKGKPSRLITFDGGGFDPLVPYIEAGIIEPYVFASKAVDTYAVLQALSTGYWPENWTNTLANGEVGGYLIEGITSMSDKMMEGLMDTGPKLGSNASFQHEVITSDGYRFKQHGASQSYYGYVQSQILKVMSSFNTLPVERIVWTALETEGEDETSRVTVLGPKAKGKALTGDLPQKFGECIHFEPYEKGVVEEKGKAFKRKIIGVRAWFKPHPQSSTGKVYAAKPRIPSFMVEELDKRFPNGYVELEPDKGVEQLFQAQIELMSKQADQLKALKAKIDSGQ